MGPSRILVAPGLRTAARAGWRSRVASAAAVVVGQPALWLLGSLGFALRGGLVLLLTSMIVLPTPVELRLLLGANLGSTGLSPAFLTYLGAAAVILGAAVLAALAVIAYIEMSAFERLARDPETAEQRGGRQALELGSGQRRRLMAGLFAVQLAALAAIALSALPLINAIYAVTYEEIVRPGLGGTIYTRVLSGVREPFFLLLACLVLVELISSMSTRRLLVGGFGLSAAAPPRSAAAMLWAVPMAVADAILRLLRRPLTTLATLVTVWALSLVALASLGWAISSAWESARAAFLGPAALRDTDAMVGAALVTLLLAAIWTMAVLMGGFVSALRAALWSVEGLR